MRIPRVSDGTNVASAHWRLVTGTDVPTSDRARQGLLFWLPAKAIREFAEKHIGRDEGSGSVSDFKATDRLAAAIGGQARKRRKRSPGIQALPRRAPQGEAATVAVERDAASEPCPGTYRGETGASPFPDHSE
jgi:hypothetical protein